MFLLAGNAILIFLVISSGISMFSNQDKNNPEKLAYITEINPIISESSTPTTTPTLSPTPTLTPSATPPPKEQPTSTPIPEKVESKSNIPKETKGNTGLKSYESNK